jgi:uncharacterized protein (TIGR02302 family)
MKSFAWTKSPLTPPIGAASFYWTGMVLTVESLLPRLWPLGLSVFLFLLLALFDVLPLLPGFLHSLLLAALGSYWLIAVIRLWQGFVMPGQMAIYHRLELDSQFANRPLTGLQDALPQGYSPAQQEWWQQHRLMLRRQLGRLRWGWPRFGFAPNDPYALRSLILLLLTIGLLQAGREWEARLGRALQPAVPPAASLLQSWEVYVRPPAYTNLPAQSLRARAGEVVTMPAGSEIFAQLHGVTARLRVLWDNQAQPVTDLGDRSWQSQFQPQASGPLVLRVGFQDLAHWPVTVLPDTAPSIAWQGEVYGTPRAMLRLGYAAADDYGLPQIWAEIRNPMMAGEYIHLDLPSQPQAKGPQNNVSYHDLAWHPWAGQKVQITLWAKDATGQTAQSPMMETTLPEREFQNPLAQKIAALRRGLQTAAVTRPQLADGLLPILLQPGEFDFDPIVTLALRVAITRAVLVFDDSQDKSLLALLWDTALRLDDAGISLAERDLRDLEQAMQQALARGAGAAELSALMDQYTAAMEKYLQSMLQQMDGDAMAAMPSDPRARALDIQDVDRLLAQIRQLMQSGQTAEAQKLLSQLQEMMANLQKQQGQSSAAQKAAMALIKQAQDLIRRQQQLVDAAATKPDGAAQIPIRQETQKFLAKLQQLTKPPADFAQAIAAMRRAEKNDAAQTVQSEQNAALAGLRAGLHALLQNMQNSGGGSMCAGSGAVDPFGRTRPGQGALDDPAVKVPGLPELQRSQEIMQELQDRSGDFNRPEIERDYIKRLLRRF